MHIRAILQATDYIPVVSTATNSFKLLAKVIFSSKTIDEKALKSHSFRNLQECSTIRSVVLLVPVLGNIVVALYDFIHYASIKKSVDLGFIDNDVRNSWNGLLRHLEKRPDDLYLAAPQLLESEIFIQAFLKLPQENPRSALIALHDALISYDERGVANYRKNILKAILKLDPRGEEGDIHFHLAGKSRSFTMEFLDQVMKDAPQHPLSRLCNEISDDVWRECPDSFIEQLFCHYPPSVLNNCQAIGHKKVLELIDKHADLINVAQLKHDPYYDRFMRYTLPYLYTAVSDDQKNTLLNSYHLFFLDDETKIIQTHEDMMRFVQIGRRMF